MGMAKFYGKIGYAETIETNPGIWEKKITERLYYGDLIRNVRKLESSENLNDNINVSNEVSILADPFARDHFHAMQYIELMNAKWKILSVEVQYPRLILTIGGLYNEQTT